MPPHEPKACVHKARPAWHANAPPAFPSCRLPGLEPKPEEDEPISPSARRRGRTSGAASPFKPPAKGQSPQRSLLAAAAAGAAAASGSVASAAGCTAGGGSGSGGGGGSGSLERSVSLSIREQIMLKRKQSKALARTDSLGYAASLTLPPQAIAASPPGGVASPGDAPSGGTLSQLQGAGGSGCQAAVAAAAEAAEAEQDEAEVRAGSAEGGRAWHASWGPASGACFQAPFWHPIRHTAAGAPSRAFTHPTRLPTHPAPVARRRGGRLAIAAAGQ